MFENSVNKIFVLFVENIYLKFCFILLWENVVVHVLFYFLTAKI
jgi:hypothetical protein